MIQLLHPGHKAKLVSLPSVQWQTAFTDDAVRSEYHKNKMASKDSRPQRQLAVACIPSGCVLHVDSSISS